MCEIHEMCLNHFLCIITYGFYHITTGRKDAVICESRLEAMPVPREPSSSSKRVARISLGGRPYGEGKNREIQEVGTFWRQLRVVIGEHNR